MTATYTFDIFTSLDGFGSYEEPGDWGGYWGKQGPELIARRSDLYDGDLRMVFGADTYRQFVQLLGMADEEPTVGDDWVTKMRHAPATIVSSTLEAPLDWPDATIATGDAVEIVTAMKAASDVPLRSHGSLSLNRSLAAAGLVDFIQVTIFPVLTGACGTEPVFAGFADFDLDLVEHRTLDGRTQELIYRPTLHG